MIHPKIMTDQKQSGTKKPLLTHYRQQLMAHEQAPAVTWTSDAGTGPGNVPASHSSPLIGHKDVFLAPDWLTVPALTPLVLDWLWKCFTRPTGAA